MSSIYIHIPFCERKCFYCDFYSIEDTALVERFVQCIEKEIAFYSDKFRDNEVSTVYFGGGTPSKIDVKYIDLILDSIYNNFKINNEPEITIEANPNSVTLNSLLEYKEYGVNRISIGIQSFVQKDLDFLQRVHTAEDAFAAIELAKKAGYDNISLDLIYAIPGSNLDEWKYNLETAISLKPKHISAYSLIFEEGTPLFDEKVRGKVLPVNEDLEADIYAFTMKYLRETGFNHYEVSNYAVPGFECRHNMNYWNFSEYLGLGPSAHSFFGKNRQWNFRDLDRYIKSLENNILPVESFEEITDDLLFEEMVFLGLRSGGINLAEIKRKFNIDFYEKNSNIIDKLIKSGYLIFNNGRLRLDDKGFLICDEICKMLI